MLTEKLTQLEFTDKDFDLAEQAAKRLGYSQTTYTTTSALWGLFCLRDSGKDRKPSGCFIKTAELGLLFVSDLEDLQFHDLASEQRKEWRKELKHR